MVCIGWGRLARARDWYHKHLNATYIDVPWWASKEVMDVTCPPASAGHTYTLDLNGKQLVASAEQSFLYLLAKGLLTRGQLYQTITPCFREERHTLFSRKHFMKCELFLTGDVDTLEHVLEEITMDARAFFSQELDVEIETVPEQHHGSHPGSFDLGVKQDGKFYELGSYGIRTHGSLGSWLYATGCAEPRTSMVKACITSIAEQHRDPLGDAIESFLRDREAFSEDDETTVVDEPKTVQTGPAGYHFADIPRGVHGELSKVAEELAEAQDAESQGSKIMLLCELSDVILAASAVAEKHGCDLDELVRMAKITRRAFQTGHRK